MKRGWVGPTACLETLQKREISCLSRHSNRVLSVIRPVAQLLHQQIYVALALYAAGNQALRSAIAPQVLNTHKL